MVATEPHVSGRMSLSEAMSAARLHESVLHSRRGCRRGRTRCNWRLMTRWLDAEEGLRDVVVVFVVCCCPAVTA